MTAACSIPECDKPQRRREWCGMHYERWRTTGDPMGLLRQRRACSLADCGELAHAQSLCRLHYYRHRRTGTTDSRSTVIAGRTSKACAACQQDTLASEFYRNQAARDGLSTNCKPCSRAKALAWYYANPERAREREAATAAEDARRRRAKLRSVTVVDFTGEQLLARLSMFSGCWICGGAADCVDHVKPLAKGGAHMLSNLRPACRACNGGKAARWPFALSGVGRSAA